MSLREQILSKREQRREAVTIDGWDFPVYVKVMSGTERDQWEWQWDELRKGEGKKHWRASLLVFCLVDEEGKAIFTVADMEAVGQLPSTDLERLHDVAFRLNKLGKREQERAEGN